MTNVKDVPTAYRPIPGRYVRKPRPGASSSAPVACWQARQWLGLDQLQRARQELEPGQLVVIGIPEMLKNSVWPIYARVSASMSVAAAPRGKDRPLYHLRTLRPHGMAVLHHDQAYGWSELYPVPTTAHNARVLMSHEAEAVRKAGMRRLQEVRLQEVQK